MATDTSWTRLARLLAGAALGGAASLAWAQAGSIPAADPTAAVPAAAYRSAFEGYRPFVDEKVGSWREANETAAQVGGHGGIFGSQGGHAAHGGAAPASAVGTATATGSASEAAAAAPPAATGGQQTREAARQRVEQERQNTPQSGHQGHQGHSGPGGR